MKKLLSAMISVILLLGGLTAVYGEENIKLVVNGKIMEISPIMMNDRVLVPIRTISEALKSDVAWDQENKAVTIFDGEYLYFLQIDKDCAFKTDGIVLNDAYKMDTAPVIFNDRTMIPIRCISEMFGAEVDWIGDERIVTVDYEDEGKEYPEEIKASDLASYTLAFSEMYDEYKDYAFDKVYTTKAEIELENGNVIGIELYNGIAPISVYNFIVLAESGAYDGKIFHRVIKDFMVQGGAFDIDNQYTDSENIPGEFLQNGYFNLIGHERGVVSMARATDYDSASNQFFIVQKDSEHLNGQYAAFGKVYSGMEYVDEIAECETDENDKPLDNIVIKTIRIIE